METVTSLAQFLQIICNRSNWMDELGDDHINPILSRENTIRTDCSHYFKAKYTDCS